MDLKPFTYNISDQEILELLSFYDESKRESIVRRALRVGLVAIRNVEIAENVDYVEKGFQKFKGDIENALALLKEEFSKRIKEADDLIREKLNNSFNPDTGIMPRVLDRYLGEGGKLSDLFDENNNTSAVSKIRNILSEYFDEDTSKVVRLLDPSNEASPLHNFKVEITDRLLAIEKEIKATESAKEAAKLEAERGTQKGLDYQDLLFAEIEKIANIFGDICFPTGNEIGIISECKLGDVVVTINPIHTGGATLRAVFEAKDKSMYIKALLEELEDAKKNRQAGVAVGVVSGRDVLRDVRDNIGVFRDYSSNLMVCVLDKNVTDPIALEIAYKLARAKLLLGLRVKEMKSESVDIAAINVIIGEITKKIGEFSSIKSTLTKANNVIGDAQDQIERMREELQNKLKELSEKASLNQVVDKGQKVSKV